MSRCSAGVRRLSFFGLEDHACWVSESGSRCTELVGAWEWEGSLEGVVVVEGVVVSEDFWLRTVLFPKCGVLEIFTYRIYVT